jgi:hypothetical protein
MLLPTPYQPIPGYRVPATYKLFSCYFETRRLALDTEQLFIPVGLEELAGCILAPEVGSMVPSLGRLNSKTQYNSPVNSKVQSTGFMYVMLIDSTPVLAVLIYRHGKNLTTL